MHAGVVNQHRPPALRAAEVRLELPVFVILAGVVTTMRKLASANAFHRFLAGFLAGFFAAFLGAFFVGALGRE